MENQKTTNGGSRKGAGRKASPDPKQTLRIYVEQSIIQANGGMDESKSETYLFLKKRSRKKKKSI